MTTNLSTSRLCPRCKKNRWIFHHDQCLRCHEQDLATRRLDRLWAEFQPASPYNKYIFEIFLAYLRKCKLRSGLAKQAEALQTILESKALPTITSWQDIYVLSERYQLWDVSYRNTGCAFKKIGRMLQALGVIGHSEEEGSNQKHFFRLMKDISPCNGPWTKSFIEMISRRNRALRTQVVYLQQLRALEIWLSSCQSDKAFATVNWESAKEYLDHLQATRTSNQLYGIYSSLNAFYRWGLHKKFIFENPFARLSVSKPSRQIRHCSERDIKKIMNYVKDGNADPESALILTLILFFGLTREDIIHAQISMVAEIPFTLILRRKNRTIGQRNYSREQMFQLPTAPSWLSNLQKRYLEVWQQRYSKIQKLFGRQPLLLPYNHWYAIPINSKIFDQRLKKATQLALDGQSVPFTVLRSTCGVLYSQNGDASLLTKFGWSRNHVFHYTYRDREVFIPKSPEAQS